MTVISVLVLIVGLSTIAYGAWGPWYSTVPLRAPQLFSKSQPQLFPFRMEHTSRYAIEVRFRKPAKRDDLVPIVGDMVRQQGGALDIIWAVVQGGQTVAQGSNRDLSHPYMPTRGTTDFEIGSFIAKRGSAYILQITPQNHEPG